MSLSIGFLLLASACTCASVAQVTAGAEDPRHVDATQFGEQVALGPNWLFAPGDNPAWAAPDLDDSGWRTVSTNRTLPEYGIRDIPYAWYRIHIQLRPGTKDVMVGFKHTFGRYEVYANGVRIGGNGSFPGPARFNQYAMAAFPVADGLVTPRGELVLVLRFAVDAVGDMGPGTSTPLRSDSGPYLMSRESAPREKSYVNAHNTADMWVLACLSLLIGLVAIALYGTLRHQREYLACAVFLFAETTFCFTYIWQQLVANTIPTLWVEYGSTGLTNFALIEFVRLVLGLPRTRWLLGLELVASLSALASPLTWAGLVPFYAGFVAYYVPILIVLILLPVLLVRASLSGNREAWVLLPAVLLRGLAAYWNFFVFVAYYTHLTKIFRSFPTLHIASYDIPLRSIGGFVFFITILLFLVLRTVGIARRHAQVNAEMEAARTVQQVLIPEAIPSVPGFQIESAYKPASEVGGDFFQILPTAGGGVLAAIGDVSGKGMPAAMTVSLLVGTFRTLAHYTQSPGAILAAMNQRMLVRSSGGFTTCLVLRADADGTVTVANAGHLAPYLGGKEMPVENGLPLGISAESTYAESKFHLASGQQITLCTDGVVEARNNGGALFGFERAAGISGQSAEGIALAAQAFGQEDDITVLTVACIA
ncbi:MAG: PP2C family protein-serine/threonine phosphatase [Terracidiphilus sp.]